MHSISQRIPAFVALVAGFTACTPARAPEKAHSEEVAMAAETKASSKDFYYEELLDPARQLYRYGSGTCRELSKLPAPWRKYDRTRYEKPGPWGLFPPGYDWGPMVSVTATELILEAEYAQLGVPPANTLPGTIRRSGLQQDVALLGLGGRIDRSSFREMRVVQQALSVARPDWSPQQSLPFKSPLGEDRVYVPMKAPFPVSAQYGVYAEGSDHLSDKSSLVIINPIQGAGVYCEQDYNWPNRSCMGVITLGEGEIATMNINYEALGTVHEVVASMIDAARAIRVDCGVDGRYD